MHSLERDAVQPAPVRQSGPGHVAMAVPAQGLHGLDRTAQIIDYHRRVRSPPGLGVDVDTRGSRRPVVPRP